jgi:CheY-like chemotaxis protein
VSIRAPRSTALCEPSGLLAATGILHRSSPTGSGLPIPRVLNPKEYNRIADEPGHARILLVEDNPADVFLVREALAWNGIKSQLFVVGDGDEAIRFLQEIERTASRCPDLVVLDVNLPRKSGFEVLRRVRASVKCGVAPVAILTSSEAPTDRSEAARLGASSYIQKPSNLRDFMSIGEKLKAILTGRL